MLRDIAGFLQMDDVIHQLEVVQHQIYGNVPRIVELGENWAAKKPSGSDAKKLGDLATDITGAATNLASYWEGSAYDAYQKYATATVTTLTTDGKAMDSMSTGLGNCAKIIYDTYSQMLTTIGNIAADLTGLNVTNFLFAASMAIPGVDLITAGAEVNKIISTLEDFVRQIAGLIAGAVKLFGDSIKTALAFDTFGSDFVAPPAVPTSFAEGSSWQVKQRPDNTTHPYDPNNGRG
ncbi:hypothetical protein [Actinophytocola sp.]|uniref:hypothetical protein n=1 Tax=Actinophytocola sp. TaxID=1872138 RepID=UPI00389AFF46